MAEKPTAAFVLSLIGGIIYLLIGVLVAVVVAFLGSISGLPGFRMAGFAMAGIGGIGLVSGILMIVGAVMMNSSAKSRVQAGSIIVLVFTLVGALFTLGGLLVGFVLALVGSILGLTWRPPATEAPPAPSPPPA